MPTKYIDRLKLPINGSENIRFSTSIGLEIAQGYDRINFGSKIPYIEFSENKINKNNIFIPENQKWRIKNAASPYVEYRSKDYCNIKIMMWKKATELQSGMFYISPFDITSDQIPVLIEPLYRKNTLQKI